MDSQDPPRDDSLITEIGHHPCVILSVNESIISAVTKNFYKNTDNERSVLQPGVYSSLLSTSISKIVEEYSGIKVVFVGPFPFLVSKFKTT